MTTAADAPSNLASQPERLAYQQSLDCVHCGLCTQHCPTYRITGDENQNPRGRIYLMRALLEGRAKPDLDLVANLDSCLVCRACESVCPSGVRFGELMAHTRHELRRPGAIRRFLLRRVIPDRTRLNRLAGLLRFWQRSIFRPIRHLLPRRLRVMESMAPEIPRASDRRPLPRRAFAAGEKKGTVALLEGCVMAVLFQDVNRDTMRLLSRAGFDVIVPEGQTCCGALHEHDGDLDTARSLARTNIAAFTAPKADAVVTNSAGCSAALVGYGHLTPDATAAARLPRIVDVTRFLLENGERLTFVARPEIVTYDAPCHLHHAQGETKAPLDLLKRVPGVRLVPLEMAELCCGAAGIYNVDHPEMSDAVLEPKLDALKRTGADVLLTGNPGCILQWRRGIARRGLSIRVEHPATFLASRLTAEG